MQLRSIILGLVVLVGVAGGAYAVWQRYQSDSLPDGFARANGRVEATQIEIASKLPGQLLEVRVREGDDVVAGQVLARVESDEVEAQLRGAESEVSRLQKSVAEAEAELARLHSQTAYERSELVRVQKVFEKGFAAKDKLEAQQTRYAAAQAAERAAQAAVDGATDAIQTGRAEIDRLKSLLVHAELKAPKAARVQYRLAEPGEILATGGRVLTLMDLDDVYMTVYLAAADAGRLAIGGEARLVMDAAPAYVFPAKVSFVAADAQFTPKSVETQSEREKLMFRVKLVVDPELVQRFRAQVKPGLRGIAYLRLDKEAAWPAELTPKLPQ
ncbi:MAG TPA: HlyD family efflux transporter periplasmic adaptor subunit [Dongiaceae bacterium]|nr:HlyD family efflux transporter periplasmic adaptor subunit [Dongiaceae bacterium]